MTIFLFIFLISISKWTSAFSSFDPLHDVTHDVITFKISTVTTYDGSSKVEHDSSKNWINSHPKVKNRIRDYDPLYFSKLADFQEVHHLSTQEKPFINTALGVIKENILGDLVSVALLHSHFKLSSTEILVEIQGRNQS